ncbi:MAG: putative toxin-antitoxin system toxin component, PIN family, partial [Chloroflexota bacterium]
VFISAALSTNPNSPTRELLVRLQKEQYILLMCDALADEITEKLEDRDVTTERIIEVLTVIEKLPEWVVAPSEKIESLLPDPDDNVIVACAVEGKANYIITYDPHFDSLRGEYRGIKIVKAIPFLEVLRDSENRGKKETSD